MHTLAEILDAARSHSAIPSDNKLADAAGVARAQISQWRHGTHVPKTDHATTLAKLSGLTEEYVLICILNAEAKHGDEARRVLQKIAGKLRRTAAAVTLAIATLFGIGHAPPARAASVDSPVMYIMENYR